ncbi:MAG: pseudouridine synthase, partial [Christensenellales bacterium]
CKFTLETFLNMKYPFVKAVHRLDLNTKGLVIFALNESAESELLQLIKEHKITKVYKAIVYAKYGIKKIKYTDYLAMDKKLQTAKITDKNSGKIAILEIINSIKIVDDIYEIELQLETGRTHQIRVQLSAHNIYVLGDGKYGDKTVNRLYKKDKQMLQAVRLKFNVEKDKLLSYLNGKVFQIVFDFKLN